MRISKFKTLKELRTEMVSVARGEKKAPKDAGKSSFESVQAMLRLVTRENR